MKKRVVSVGAVVLLLSVLPACGTSNSGFGGSVVSSADGSAAGSAAVSVEQTQQEQSAGDEWEAQEHPRDRGALGAYYIRILEMETGLENAEGTELVGIRYEFTNSGADQISFDTAVFAQAFQNGEELKLDNPKTCAQEYSNTTKVVEPGTVLVCEQYYALIDSEYDVETVVSPLVSFQGEDLAKTFHLTQ